MTAILGIHLEDAIKSFKIHKLTAVEIAQWVKVLAIRIQWPEFNLWIPQGMGSQSCPLTTSGPCTQGLKPLLPTPSKSPLKENKRRQAPAVYRVSFTQWDWEVKRHRSRRCEVRRYTGVGEGTAASRSNSLFLWPPMAPAMCMAHTHSGDVLIHMKGELKREVEL